MKEVLQSLEGSHIESDQRLKMNIASQHMDQIDSHVRRLETEMAIRCIPYATLINLLVDIPGISYLSARTIIAEIVCFRNKQTAFLLGRTCTFQQ